MAYKGPQVVIGPGSSTDNTVPRFDLTSGALIQGSSVVISDADAVSGITQLDVDNIRVNDNTISSTDTNGNIVLAPDGSGVVSVTTAPIVPSGNRADSLGSSTNSWDNVYCDGITFDDGTNVLGAYTAATSWTPALAFGGGTSGITYTIQSGRYVIIGKIAIVTLSLQISSKGTSTGAATITGFPLTTASLAQNCPVALWNQIAFTGSQSQPIFNIAGSTSTFNAFQCGNGTNYASLTDANFGAGSNLTGNFVLHLA